MSGINGRRARKRRVNFFGKGFGRGCWLGRCGLSDWNSCWWFLRSCGGFSLLLRALRLCLLSSRRSIYCILSHFHAHFRLPCFPFSCIGRGRFRPARHRFSPAAAAAAARRLTTMPFLGLGCSAFCLPSRFDLWNDTKHASQIEKRISFGVKPADERIEDDYAKREWRKGGRERRLIYMLITKDVLSGWSGVEFEKNREAKELMQLWDVNQRYSSIYTEKKGFMPHRSMTLYVEMYLMLKP